MCRSCRVSLFTLFSLAIMIICSSGCSPRHDSEVTATKEVGTQEVVKQEREYFVVSGEVLLRNYFQWMDSTLVEVNEDRLDTISEYELVHANLWIINALRKTDYYYQLEAGFLLDDVLSQVVLFRNDSLLIPSQDQLENIRISLFHTYLDINIPEYRLKIVQHDTSIYEMPIRVGKNDTAYLKMAGRTIDMRTKPGQGNIVEVIKNPTFINPKDNHIYTSTRRDDNRRTTLPNIPWLLPEINGFNHGQLLHPTTNKRTLGRAASNGCIGMSEADAWTTYYYAPVGTAVKIRYDLEVVSSGDTIKLLDVYPEKSMLFRHISNSIKGTIICDCN